MNYTPTKKVTLILTWIYISTHDTRARTSIPTYLQIGEPLCNSSWLLTCARFAMIWISYQDHGHRVKVEV